MCSRRLHKIASPSTNNCFYALITLSNDEESIKIHADVSSVDESFQGELNTTSIQAQIESLGTTITQFVANARKALIDDVVEGDEGEVVLHVDHHHKDNRRTLVWRVEKKNGLKVELGRIPLKPIEDGKSSITSLLDTSIEDTISLRRQLAEQTKKIDELSKDRDMALSVATKANEKAAYLQNDVYQKFARILNAKKQKIDELMNDNLQIIPTSSAAPRLTALNVSDSDDGGDTDQENAVIEDRRRTVNKSKSTSSGDVVIEQEVEAEHSDTDVPKKRAKKTKKKTLPTPRRSSRSTKSNESLMNELA